VLGEEASARTVLVQSSPVRRSFRPGADQFKFLLYPDRLGLDWCPYLISPRYYFAQSHHVACPRLASEVAKYGSIFPPKYPVSVDKV